MDWIPIAWKAFGVRAEIARLITVLRPAIAEVRKVAPEAMVLIQNILAQVAPEARKQFEAEVAEKRDIYWLQASLNRLGEHLELDGQYGPATTEAVKRFQAKHNLTVDGWAGTNTSAAIYGALEGA